MAKRVRRVYDKAAVPLAWRWWAYDDGDAAGG